MNEFQLYQVSSGIAALAAFWAARWCARLTPEKLPRVEPLPRLRMAGAILGLIALIGCIPHARPIVFDWMVPYLWPTAIAGAILGYFFLDYLLARALGGLAILASYYFVHGAFDFHTTGMAALSIAWWIVGIAGICVSGKPCWMRDWLRLMCQKPVYRYGTSCFLTILAILCAVGLLIKKGILSDVI